LKQLANIKADASLLDMVIVPEQQKHLKDFMEGKASIISGLTEQQNEEEMYINKLGVYNNRNHVNILIFMFQSRLCIILHIIFSLMGDLVPILCLKLLGEN